MVKIKTEEPKSFRSFFDVMAKVLPEACFQISDQGIKLNARDPSSVVMVDFHLKAEFFDEFEVDDQKEIGVNIDKLRDILKRSGNSDTIIIDDIGSKMNIQISNGSKKEFKLPLRDVESQDIDEDSFAFSSFAELTPDVFQEGIDDAAVMGDAAEIIVNNEELEIKTADSNEAKFTADKSEGGIRNLKGDGEGSRYALDFLEKIMSARKLSDELSIKFGPNQPLSLEFQEDERFRLKFLLAPRITG